jgi:hypothetical protein
MEKRGSATLNFYAVAPSHKHTGIPSTAYGEREREREGEILTGYHLECRMRSAGDSSTSMCKDYQKAHETTYPDLISFIRGAAATQTA